MTVRTRFAPSPTGYMHIGNLRTALYEYLVAKNLKGDFILRIEDTDQERYVEGAVDLIYKSLKKAGISHDEGPDVGGNFGPYVQSERKAIYKPYAEELITKGEAYYCFCTKERLANLREKIESSGKTYNYDRKCLELSEDEMKNNLETNIPYVIRQKSPDNGYTSYIDGVYGKISIENTELEDQVLIKADGLPTYNFANVIDDHLMEITHVVRGSEYLSSTPKYILLYNAFGWVIPHYVHLPLITKEGGAKISKRAGDASFEDLLELGYLPEAIVNYIALLGWSPGNEREMFTLKDLEENFTVKGISKSPSVFNFEKLNWFNGEYIRKMTSEEFYNIAEPYIKSMVKKDSVDIKKLSEVLQKRTIKLTEIPENIDFIDELPEYDNEFYQHKKMKTNSENSLIALGKVLPVLESINEWNEDNIHEKVFKLVEEMEIKNGQMLWPIRTALSGKKVSPGGGIDIGLIIGKDETIKRIKVGIAKLKEELNG